MNGALRESRHCFKARATLAGTSIATLLIAACTAQPPAGQVSVAGRPECPQDSVIVTLADSDRGVPVQRTIRHVSVSRDISHVPEYHDCQRLALGNGPTYGPLAAVFAAKGLDSLFPPDHQDTTMAAARAAGEILVYDGYYKPLELMPGFSCLYLWESKPREWEALIQAVGVDQEACLDPPSSSYPQWRFEVREVPAQAGMFGADHPPVARWDWDPQHHYHYIGIRCGDQWCEIAGKKFQSSNSHAGDPMGPPRKIPGKPDPTPKEARRVVAIKGWYDEQRLAIADAPGKPLTTGALIGTAFPHPLLGTLDDVDDFKAMWIPVATVRLDGAPAGHPTYAKYKAKLNFERGDNEVELCRSDPSMRCVPEGMEPSTTCDADSDGSRWWARIISPTDTAYRCVTRRRHPESMPGTVRWRWLLDDETLWVRCSFGCCTVEP
jgi:hypothetical protein